MGHVPDVHVVARVCFPVPLMIEGSPAAKSLQKIATSPVSPWGSCA